MNLDTEHQSESKKILMHVRAVLKTLRRPELVAMRTKIKNLADLAKDETHPNHEKRKSVYNSHRTAYRQALSTKYSQLNYCYPAIFNMLADTDPEKFEMHRLVQMLKMRDQAMAHRDPNKVKSEIEKMSVKVGQDYFNEFVKPMVDADTDAENSQDVS